MTSDQIATVTPYVADLTVGLTSFLAEAGVEVVAAAGLGLTSDIWTVPYDVTAGLVRDTDTARRPGRLHQLHQPADL